MALESQIAALKAEFASEEEEFAHALAQEELRRQALLQNREEIARLRQADESAIPDNGNKT
jgi:hypothetical protein